MEAPLGPLPIRLFSRLRSICPPCSAPLASPLRYRPISLLVEIRTRNLLPEESGPVLTPPVLTGRLINANHHLVALRISQYLSLNPVPLLLSIQEEDSALVKAIDSGDTDLVYLVLFHIWQKKPALDFFGRINERPLARDLFITYSSAMRSWHTMIGKHLGAFRTPTWKLRCQKQTCNEECGYYVMRHMLNIVSAKIVDSWDKIFTNKDPFSEDEIDEVKRCWATYLLEVVNAKV